MIETKKYFGSGKVNNFQSWWEFLKVRRELQKETGIERRKAAPK